MASGRPTPTRDAIVSAVAAMAIGGISLILYAYKVYWALLLIAIGVAVFLSVLVHHPARFYRRAFWACLGLLSALLLIPAIHFSGVFGKIAAVELVIESVGTGGVVALCALCCVALGASAWVDYVRQRPGPKEEDSTVGENTRAPVQSQIAGRQVYSASGSPVIEHAQAVQIIYESDQRAPDGQQPQPSRPAVKDEGSCLWPDLSLPHGGPKVSEPFAGREEELRELAAGIGGDKKVVAVVGMAGQGKSCLVGEWYKRGARPPQGVGLFWRKVYEAGYTFDRFLDELHLYLAGEPIDRMQVKTVRDRATVVEGLLAGKPCWIVLDGVERWLKRWVSEPDATAQNATRDDRAGHDPVLDKFLKGVSFWENGSRLLLTTRAVPSALDENLPLMIGEEHGREKQLKDLKLEEAIRLLDELEVKGEEKTKGKAVRAYGCHAYAVHVLGVLIRDLYGGDVSRWQEVNPLRESKLGGLFERIIETHEGDVPLLEFVACSLGPAPVGMLAELTARDEVSVRRSLARLKKWQMVEFEGSEAEQHAIVRQFLIARIGAEGAKARRKQIAARWAQRKTPVNPTRIDEVRPLLWAVEHLAAARDPDAATDILLRKPSAESYYTVVRWLQAFGYLDEDIRINGLVIGAYIDLIENESRRELRHDLAGCYNNRGTALAAQGQLSEAIADYGRAIEIYAGLVEREGRRELRNDLASCYNNRGTALVAQGCLAEAIADYSRAIEIRASLVEREGRRELRNDLASCYNNRGNALADRGHLAEAVADYGRAIEIREGLVEREGWRELRHDLAGCYNNRGHALAAQGHLAEAIADCARAIEIYVGLVEREGRRELRHDLAGCYNNRGNALMAQGRLVEAIAEYGRAIEIRQGLVEREGRRELRNDLAGCYNNRGNALADQGHLAEAIADYRRAIEIRQGLVEREGRRELRNDLAGCYSNLGLALAAQGRLAEAIGGYGRAIEIYAGLVEREGRRELRNALAGSYSNRGLALAAQGRLAEAIADYGRAIEIREGLVEREGRHELRSGLASSLLNRAAARSQTGEWQQAVTDIDKGAALLRALVEEGQRHILGALLQTLGFRCQHPKELGDPAQAAQGANEAMRWFLEEVEQKRTTPPLLKAAAGFAEDVRGNRKLLLKHGLDEVLWRNFEASLPAGDSPPAGA